MAEYRIEADSLGEVRVPAEAYWGAHTQRATEQLPITNHKPDPAWIWGMALVKRAAAQVNSDLGLFKDKSIGEQIISGDAIVQAIIVAADEVLEGKWDSQFVIDPLQIGAMASYDHNVNEVLANLANEHLGYRLSDPRKPVSPAEHVNMGQTTADTMTAAVRLGCLHRLPEVQETLAELAITLRQALELEICALSIERSLDKLRHSAEDLRRLGIGGTAIDGDPEFHSRMVATLGRLTTLTLYQSDNPLEAINGMGDFSHFSGALRTIAQELIRTAAACRFEPTTKMAEPAQMLHMAMLQILGNDQTIMLAGQTEPSNHHPFLPLIAHNLFQSMNIVINSTRLFGQAMEKRKGGREEGRKREREEERKGEGQ